MARRDRSHSDNPDSRRKKAARRRPSRVDIPPEAKQLILASIAAGASIESAVRSAGISPRTFRELRQRAWGRHRTRAPLLHLKPFFAQVEQAAARRLAANEIRISDVDPKFSLKYLQARLQADADDEDALRVPTAEEM